MIPTKLHRGTPEEALSVLFIYLFADLPLPPVLAVRTDDTEETSMFSPCFVSTQSRNCLALIHRVDAYMIHDIKIPPILKRHEDIEDLH